MFKTLFAITLACLLFQQTFQSILIQSPQELTNQFINGKIDAKYSLFGNYKYGFSTIGKIFYHKNAINNTIDTDYACKDLKSIEQELVNESSGNSDIAPIVLIDRGACTFVTKVRNVQRIGGKVALIVNNIDDDEQIVAINDDGTGTDITIPGILISKKAGEKIKNFIKTNNAEIILNIDNRIEEQLSDEVNFFLNFLANDKKVYKTLNLLKNNKDIFEGNHINFVPNYVTVHHFNYNETANVKNSPKQDCFCGGRYCSYGHNYFGDSFLNTISGESVLTESIRQKCIYQLAYKKYNSHNVFWNYMSEFYSKCIQGNTFDLACSRKVIQTIDKNILYDIEKCYLDSFVNEDQRHDSSSCLKNTILEADKNSVSKRMKAALPIINVNNHTLFGAWSSENVLEALCANVLNKPSSCYTNLKVFDNDNFFLFTNYQLVCFAIFLVILNGLILFYCRRYVNRKMESTLLQDDDINSRIKSIVSGYMRMNDKN